MKLTLSPDHLTTLHECGYLVINDLIPEDELVVLREEVDRLLAESTSKGGVRNVLGKSALLADLAAGSPLRDLAKAVLGDGAQPRKLTIFDKTPNANWKVPWHQDLTIAVRERRELPGYGPWTVKNGVVHVQPPVAVLEQILAVRLHLDDTDAENGALRVLPGSHKLGRLTDEQIDSARRRIAEEVCSVAAGGAMLMLPLLVHASSTCARTAHRRVIHIEYAAIQLPGGLDWA